MLISFFYAVRRQFLDEFPGIWGVVFDAFAIFLNLLVYWFTAKAFGACFDIGFTQKTDYFTYVVIGDVFLAIPHILIMSISRTVRTAISDGSLEIYLTLPNTILTFIVLGLALIPREFIRYFFVLLIALFLFQFKVSATGFFLSLFLQLLAWPTFLGMGFIAAAILIFFGRGSHALAQFSNLLIILAGAYFPISVFPEKLATISKNLSPFSLLLEANRELLQGGEFPWKIALVFCGLSAIFLALGFVIFLGSLKNLRKHGSPLLLAN